MRTNFLTKRTTLTLLVAFVILTWVVNLRARSGEPIAYPSDFRKWVRVTTMIVGPQSPFFKTAGGIHHVYANEKAMQGYETGKFPDGAILVFDLLDTKETDGTTTEGPRQRIDVMLKDTHRFPTTGGWGFERFLGDSETDRPLTEEHRGLCFTCHGKRKAQDFLFSTFRK